MKQYSIALILASALTFGSCSDFLDRDPLSQASENTFWQTEADALAGVSALYPLLPNSRDFWRDCQSDNSLIDQMPGAKAGWDISVRDHITQLPVTFPRSGNTTISAESFISWNGWKV